MNATLPDDGSEELEFTGDITDYWSYTQVRDWVLLLPEMSRTALHLYLLLRSMLTEKRIGGLRRMSLDQLCWLLPGVNGKPASLTMIKDALRLLESHNLVVNPDGTRLVTSGGKNGIQNTFRKYKVNDLPPDAFTGWRNVWDKLDAYTQDWRTNPPQPPTHVRTETGVSRKSDHRSDQQRSTEPAAHFEGRISDERGRKSDRAGRKTDQPRRKNGATPPLTSGNAAPKEAPQRSSSLSAAPPVPAAPSTLADTVTDERETTASPDKTEQTSAQSLPASSEVGRAVAGAWADARQHNGHDVPSRAPARIARDVVRLLAEGEDAEHLLAAAVDMARDKRWFSLEQHLEFFTVQAALPEQRSVVLAECTRCYGSGILTDDQGVPVARCDCTVRTAAPAV